METGLKMLVKSAGGFGDGAGVTGVIKGTVGATLSGGAGCGSGDLSDWNICVKLPGLPVDGAATGEAGGDAGAGACGVDPAFSRD